MYLFNFHQLHGQLRFWVDANSWDIQVLSPFCPWVLTFFRIVSFDRQATDWIILSASEKGDNWSALGLLKKEEKLVICKSVELQQKRENVCEFTRRILHVWWVLRKSVYVSWKSVLSISCMQSPRFFPIVKKICTQTIYMIIHQGYTRCHLCKCLMPAACPNTFGLGKKRISWHPTEGNWTRWRLTFQQQDVSWHPLHRTQRHTSPVSHLQNYVLSKNGKRGIVDKNAKKLGNGKRPTEMIVQAHLTQPTRRQECCTFFSSVCSCDVEMKNNHHTGLASNRSISFLKRRHFFFVSLKSFIHWSYFLTYSASSLRKGAHCFIKSPILRSRGLWETISLPS